MTYQGGWCFAELLSNWPRFTPCMIFPNSVSRSCWNLEEWFFGFYCNFFLKFKLIQWWIKEILQLEKKIQRLFTIRNRRFSKGSTWLKCPHWPKWCSLSLKAWGMKNTWFFWLVLLIEVIHFDQMLSCTSIQEGQNF